MRTRSVGLAIAALFPAVVFACGLDDSVVVPGAIDGADGGVDGTVIPQDGAIGDSSVIVEDGHVAPDSGPVSPQLIYANSQGELYSLDVMSSTLTDLGALNGCGSPTNQDDLGVDSTGQLYLLQKSDAIYKLDTGGNCTDRSPLNMDGADIDKIAGRNNGTPVVLALNATNDDLYGIDLSTPNVGNTTKINPDIFPLQNTQFGVYDVTCSSGGLCWTALAIGCTAGLTSSCLYTFPDDGGQVASSLGAVNVQPAGLAYANRSLYSFQADGSILKIPLDVAPLVGGVVTLKGAPAPEHWFGAASTPANP